MNKYIEPIFCIMGRTCSGKDSLVKALCEEVGKKYNISPVVSYTDRPKRDNETEGVEHYFCTTERFNEIKKIRKPAIMAYTQIKKDENSEGYQYMALIDDLEAHNIYIIDPNGYEDLQRRKKIVEHRLNQLNFYMFIPILITCPEEERECRAKESRSDYDKYEERCINEDAQFTKAEENATYHKISNGKGEFQSALEELKRIVERYVYA